MKSLRLLIFLTILGSTTQTKAWDEVTHAYMTQMIPDLVKDAELKNLLQNNLDEYVYGSWYTDTYQYTGSKTNRINTLNPHYIATYGKAFQNYLQKEDVIQQANYDKLVALYLGSLSHLLEDFWYDSNLSKYQKTKDDKYKGDSKYGTFVAKQHGYINLKVRPYFPKEDLFKMYQEAGMIEEEYDSLEKFEELLNAWSDHQYLLLRSLKLVNFLAGNQMYNGSPWTAGNLKEIKGGMINSAEVTAIFIEEVWNSIKQKQEPKILHTDYFEFDNKIAFLTSVPINIDELSGNDLFLLNNSKDTICGKIKQFEHNDKKKGITKYTVSFYPEEELKTGNTYTFRVKANNIFPSPFSYTFKTGTYIETLAKPKPFLSTIGLGVFGFIPLLALAGLLFGMAGIIRFNWTYKKRYKKLPLIHLTILRILQLTSVLVLAYGFYVLATRGEMILGMAW
jgi:hypothetical protein